MGTGFHGSPGLDWRRHYDALSYSLIDTPARLAKGVRAYLDAFGLVFDAFDFGLDPMAESGCTNAIRTGTSERCAPTPIKLGNGGAARQAALVGRQQPNDAHDQHHTEGQHRALGHSRGMA
ncbi:hypothetical protein [Streptomyces sp. CT34]|uniref:hypothetical protein n=1 Tax=Streptomyces sp. CT34 TaxID=1553907 RepID=UPI0005B87148|nr:hypothetical protein [Streptomyces sp. CT34]